MNEEIPKMKGIFIGLTEVILFGFVSYLFRINFEHLENLNPIFYYWLCLTILTGVWESSFLSNYLYINKRSKLLISSRKHVWDTDYTINYLLPWKLSEIFYAEYGAWADREYMTIKNKWSRIIEGTHAVFCGSVSMYCLINGIEDNKNTFLVLASVAMGSQLMNSILYMSEYFIQLKQKDNLNYDCVIFPAGKYLLKRPFMYVNIFWTLMPAYSILVLLQI